MQSLLTFTTGEIEAPMVWGCVMVLAAWFSVCVALRVMVLQGLLTVLGLSSGRVQLFGVGCRREEPGGQKPVWSVRLNTVGTGNKPPDPFGAPANIAVSNFVTAAKALVVNERIDESLAIMRKINPQFAHMVYWKQHRHREALELAKVTPKKTLDATWL